MIKIALKIPYARWFTIRRMRSMPESWSDIEPSKRLEYFKILWLDTEKTALVSILKEILRLPNATFLGISNADIGKLVEHLEWMREDLTVNALVPEFEHEGIRYYFPKTDFDNGTAREYALADEYYNAFATDQEDTDALILLTSVLARPMISAPNFSREIVESRLESFKKLPFEVVLIALRYFEALKKEVYDLGVSVDLFNTLSGESEEETSDIIEFGWWTSYRYIAKSQVFGNFDDVCNSLFWDVFKHLIEEKQRENIAEKARNTPPPNN